MTAHTRGALKLIGGVATGGAFACMLGLVLYGNWLNETRKQDSHEKFLDRIVASQAEMVTAYRELVHVGVKQEQAMQSMVSLHREMQAMVIDWRRERMAERAGERSESPNPGGA